MIIKCTLCKRDLPETEFYPSALKRGQHQCKKCSYEKYGKKNIDKYQKSIKNLDNRNFNTFYGGYTVFILNYTRPMEYKYTIKGTDGFLFQTNDTLSFKKKMGELV